MSNLKARLPGEAKTSTVAIGNRKFELVHLAGLPDWKVINPAVQLVAGSLEIQPEERVLMYGSYQGGLAAYLASYLPAGQLSIIDNSYTAIESTRLTLAMNKLPIDDVNILEDINLPSNFQQSFTSVIMLIPKGRQIARRWLIQAFEALSPGGRFYLVGANHSGIQSVIKDAQALFGLGSLLGYKKGNRLALFIKSGQEGPTPEWANEPGIAPHTWVEFSAFIGNHEYKIRSLPGVFSYDQLDEGTKFLLDGVEIPPSSRVLDMGCGYGIIGLFAASHGADSVDMVDNNLLAIAASQETLRINQQENIKVFPRDLLNDPISEYYDLILSNPPFHTGQAVDYRIAQAMIHGAYNSLSHEGRLVIVANRFIRYDRIIREIFGNVSIEAESGKFHVLSGLKSA